MSMNNHAKHKGIKIENIKIGTQYAFTLNPEEQPTSNSKKDVWVWYRKIYQLIQPLHGLIDITLYLEISPTGRYHFHGFIVPYDIHIYVTFLLVLKKVAVYEIDTISEQSVWMKYVHKQSNIWIPYFDKNVVGYPLSNQFKPVIES